LNTIDNTIRYRFTDFPGHYRLKGVLDQGPVLRGFSVNLPEAATDLSRIEPDELDGVLGPERYQLARQKDEIQRQQGTTRIGQEFYPLLMLMMLIALGVEYLMSNRFYQSRRQPPRSRAPAWERAANCLDSVAGVARLQASHD
jgi:cytochrome c-type biogenesis protein CcmH/NrfG